MDRMIRWRAKKLEGEITVERVLEELNDVFKRPETYHDALVAFRHLTQENRRRRIRRALFR